MEKQKKRESGITLIALVISIIVMMILAGVSLNATIGENGIVTKAQEAALQQRIASQLEELKLELAKINIDTISTDETMAIQDIANYLVGQETIDGFVTTSSGQIAAGIDTLTGNKYFFGVKGDNTYRITRGTDGLLDAELTTQTSGGDITGGYALITEESFNNDTTLPEEEKGKFTITDDSEVVFFDSISGELSIYVNNGVHAKVSVYADLTLTNSNISRSAIDIEPGGELDLYIDDGVEVMVNSGFATEAVQADNQAGDRGVGGFAGIHVPYYSDTTTESERTVFRGRDKNNNAIWVTYDAGVAILNLSGSGTITCVGGNASMGGDARAGDIGGSGGGGAGAGIGGNGGQGGLGGSGLSAAMDTNYQMEPGGKGEDCGIVNISGDLTVIAKGGGGASGYMQNHTNAAYSSSGTGAGGYPAAGIGGGGAGGGAGSHINGRWWI